MPALARPRTIVFAGNVENQPRLVVPAVSLVVAQVAHAVLPAPSEDGPSVGPVAGAVLLVAAVVASAGTGSGRRWARPLVRWTGAAVAMGFLLYHALPITSPLTFPYWGRDDVGVLQWLPVLLAIVVGAWCVWATTIQRESTNQ